MKINLKILLLFTVLLLYMPLISRAQSFSGVTLAIGPYAAEGLGTNMYYEIRYDHYLSKGTYLFEGGFGIGSIHSDMLKSVARSGIFEGETLITYQFLFGYDMKRTNIPYLMTGFSGISQGGQSRFAFVLGVGEHFSLWGMKRFRLRYDIRDHIFSQEINSGESFIVNNLVFTLGLEYPF